MVKGNVAIYEYIIEADPVKGARYETPGVCIHELKNDKIQNLRAVYDRLSAAKQSAKGTVDRRVVNAVMNRWDKGLH